MKMYIGIFFPQDAGCLGQKVSAYGFAGADVNVSCHHAVRLGQLHLCFLNQVENFLRSSAEQKPFRGQGDAVAVPFKKGMTQLLFQIPNLSRKSGLGDMQQPGRAGDVALLRNCEKIAQYTQFHKAPPWE